jgi:hypothetical protein
VSRFTGPQQRGASRGLSVRRRGEAEARQCAESERDRERAAAHVEPEPLTDEELWILAAIALRGGMDWWPR